MEYNIYNASIVCAHLTGKLEGEIIKALRGEIDTPASKMVIAITEKLVEQRLERIEYLKKVVKPLYIRNYEA